MISSLQHVDNVQRHLATTHGYREIVNGAAVNWLPIDKLPPLMNKPAELVRRMALLEKDVLYASHLHSGNEIVESLRAYVRGLAVEGGAP
jgi:hypothetical protein